MLRQRYMDMREAIMRLKARGKNDAAHAVFDEPFNGHTLDYVRHLKQMLTMRERAIDAQAKQIGTDADRQSDNVRGMPRHGAESIASAALFSRSLFRRMGGEPAAAAAIVAGTA